MWVEVWARLFLVAASLMLFVAMLREVFFH